jgi:hypothetical protein
MKERPTVACVLALCSRLRIDSAASVLAMRSSLAKKKNERGRRRCGEGDGWGGWIRRCGAQPVIDGFPKNQSVDGKKICFS